MICMNDNILVLQVVVPYNIPWIIMHFWFRPLCVCLSFKEQSPKPTKPILSSSTRILICFCWKKKGAFGGNLAEETGKSNQRLCFSLPAWLICAIFSIWEICIKKKKKKVDLAAFLCQLWFFYYLKVCLPAISMQWVYEEFNKALSVNWIQYKSLSTSLYHRK